MPKHAPKNPNINPIIYYKINPPLIWKIYFTIYAILFFFSFYIHNKLLLCNNFWKLLKILKVMDLIISMIM